MSQRALLIALALTMVSAVEHRPGAVVRLVQSPSEMVVVPSGAFQMGMPDAPEEMEYVMELCLSDFGSAAQLLCMPGRFASFVPSRQVHVEEFRIDRHETRVSEYRQCVRAGDCDIGPLLFGDQRYNKSEWPIVNVSWNDAVSYCAWRDKRLPTEAEWEKAARGPSSFRWPWGQTWRHGGSNHGRLASDIVVKITTIRDEWNLEFVSDDSDGQSFAAEPGSMVWGASSYGAADMAGNVSEWVQDYYSEQGYGDLPTIDPVRDTPSHGKRRVFRGGAWDEPRLYSLSYDRRFALPSSRLSTVGFRCAQGQP